MNAIMKSTTQSFLISSHRQAGMALITGLIFMVVLTLLALAAMRTATLEERMSGNTRDRDMAFQSAEAALRAGELVLQGASLPAFASGTAYTTRIAAGTQTTYWQNTHPWATQSVAAWQPTGTNAAPRYVIEDMSASSCAGGSMTFGPAPGCSIYRVTARGVGRSATTMVILQAVYKR